MYVGVSVVCMCVCDEHITHIFLAAHSAVPIVCTCVCMYVCVSVVCVCDEHTTHIFLAAHSAVLIVCTCVCMYVGVSVVVVSMLILLFDIEIPNELKGFIFYAQVSRLVIRVCMVTSTYTLVSLLACFNVAGGGLALHIHLLVCLHAFMLQVVGLLYSPYVVVQTDPNITQHTTVGHNAQMMPTIYNYS